MADGVSGGDMERLVRRLVLMLREEVLPETVLATSVDYADPEGGPVRAVPMASLPALVLSGPSLVPSPAYATNVRGEAPVPGGVSAVGPSRTVDLEFSLTAASRGTAELLSIAERAERFFNRHPWISMARDADRPELGDVRWEMDSTGPLRMSLGGPSGVRSFSGGLAVRGFDVDEGAVSGTVAAPVGGVSFSTGPLAS